VISFLKINSYLVYHQNFDATVCALDWSKFSKQLPQVSASNVPAIGKFLGEFLMKVNGQGVPYDHMTIIGHSMGAHIAGVAGHYLNGQINSIYGLDPAGPFFYDGPLNSSKSNNDRLDKSDAKFVQAIHTNVRTFGTPIQVGHQDFYPNGGELMSGCRVIYPST
jgi:phosphatidylserine sn-1 acylhydrolase